MNVLRADVDARTRSERRARTWAFVAVVSIVGIAGSGCSDDGAGRQETIGSAITTTSSEPGNSGSSGASDPTVGPGCTIGKLSFAVPVGWRYNVEAAGSVTYSCRFLAPSADDGPFPGTPEVWAFTQAAEPDDVPFPLGTSEVRPVPGSTELLTIVMLRSLLDPARSSSVVQLTAHGPAVVPPDDANMRITVLASPSKGDPATVALLTYRPPAGSGPEADTLRDALVAMHPDGTGFFVFVRYVNGATKANVHALFATFARTMRAA